MAVMAAWQVRQRTSQQKAWLRWFQLLVYWLVVWNILYFPQYLGWWSNLIFIFFRGVETTNQVYHGSWDLDSHPQKPQSRRVFLFHIMMKLWIGNSPRWRGCKVGLKDDGPWAPWDPSRVTTGSQTLGSCCSKWIVFFQVFNEVVRNYLYFSFTGMNRQYWHSDSIAGWLILLTHTRVLWLLLCFVFRVDSFTGTHVVQLITTARHNLNMYNSNSLEV